MEKYNFDEAFCPHYHRAVEIVGRRWSGAILRALMYGATRFVQIRQTIPELSDKMLSTRLRELEADGLVVRTVVPDTPVRIEYRLTDKGLDLEKAVASLSDWADRWITEDEITPSSESAAS